jgi:hypothetical protein
MLMLAACVRPTPPVQAPLQPGVPPGCLADLSGRWVHAVDPAYMYDATDDGGTLTLMVHRAPVDAGFRPRVFRADAGAPRPVDAGGPAAGALPSTSGGETAPDDGVVVLERTPRGFVGEARATLTHPAGRRCDARFRAEVVECSDGGLLLEAESATALGEGCEPPANALPVPRVEQRLIRAP